MIASLFIMQKYMEHNNALKPLTMPPSSLLHPASSLHQRKSVAGTGDVDVDQLQGEKAANRTGCSTNAGVMSSRERLVAPALRRLSRRLSQFRGFTLPTKVEVGNHFGMEAYFPFFRASVRECFSSPWASSITYKNMAET